MQQTWRKYQTCYKVVLTTLIQTCCNKVVTNLTTRDCEKIVLSSLHQSCWNNFVTNLISPSICYKLLTTSPATWNKQCEHNLSTACEQICNNLFAGWLQQVRFYTRVVSMSYFLVVQFSTPQPLVVLIYLMQEGLTHLCRICGLFY